MEGMLSQQERKEQNEYKVKDGVVYKKSVSEDGREDVYWLIVGKLVHTDEGDL